MILRFLISGYCYAQTNAFSTHFLQIFLDDLFFARQAFSTQKTLKTYQYLSHPASSVPPNIFHCQHGGKILGSSQQWAKIKIIGGWRLNIGGMYPPIPRDLQPWVRLTITMCYCYRICKSLLYQIMLNRLLYPKILGVG